MRIVLARFAVALLAVTLLALSAGYAWQRNAVPGEIASECLTEPVLLPSRAGAVPFNHVTHAALRGTSCERCHHTSAGAQVEQGCRACHRAEGAFVASREVAFHGQCIGCHRQQERAGVRTGPAARCSGCHAG